MPLDTEVGLGPGDIALDVDPAPPKKDRAAANYFRPMSTAAKLPPISAAAEFLCTLLYVLSVLSVARRH